MNSGEGADAVVGLNVLEKREVAAAGAVERAVEAGGTEALVCAFGDTSSFEATNLTPV